MFVGDVYNRDVVFAHRSESAQTAAHLMRQYHVGDVIVVEQKEGHRVPVGIVTDRDIVVEVVAEEVDIEAITLGDIMSEKVVTAQEEDSLWETLKRMQSQGVRRLPVVDTDKALIGIVTMDDLVILIAEVFNDLASLISREQEKEEHTRR